MLRQQLEVYETHSQKEGERMKALDELKEKIAAQVGWCARVCQCALLYLAHNQREGERMTALGELKEKIEAQVR